MVGRSKRLFRNKYTRVETPLSNANSETTVSECYEYWLLENWKSTPY